MNTITTWYGVFATNKNGKTEFFNYYNFNEERAACFALVMHYAALVRKYGDQDIKIVERLPRC